MRIASYTTLMNCKMRDLIPVMVRLAENVKQPRAELVAHVRKHPDLHRHIRRLCLGCNLYFPSQSGLKDHHESRPDCIKLYMTRSICYGCYYVVGDLNEHFLDFPECSVEHAHAE